MYRPLCDIPEHTQQLCAIFELGISRDELSRLTGGFHHLVWRLSAGGNSYAVKQLSPDTDLEDPATVAHYNTTESIAEKFSAAGVHAIHALKNHLGYLQLIDNMGYLVYPWTDAIALDKDRISESHALKVAQLLARMHQSDINVPELEATAPQIVSADSITYLVKLAAEHRLVNARELERQLPHFLQVSKRHSEALLILDDRQVVSHGDLDQKNVLWETDGSPVLIDWECAHRLNPAYEAVLEALDWSGLTSSFSRELFEKFISAYSKAGGIIRHREIEAAFHCIAGEWLDWLVYNIGRTVNIPDPEQRALGYEQVNFALSTMLKLEGLFPELLELVQRNNA